MQIHKWAQTIIKIRNLKVSAFRRRSTHFVLHREDGLSYKWFWGTGTRDELEAGSDKNCNWGVCDPGIF